MFDLIRRWLRRRRWPRGQGHHYFQKPEERWPVK